MVDNLILDGEYLQLQNGVIKQKDGKIEIKYGIDYISKGYSSLIPDEILTKMAGLRLGYLLGSIDEDINSILDVGYGSGEFLKVCVDRGINSEGIDVPEVPLPDNVIQGNFNKPYDVICFFDSLEHFPNIDFVKDLDCKYIYISAPWCHYCSNPDLEENWFRDWKHRKYGEHLWHFDDKSLTNFLREHNFEVIKVSNIEDTIRKGTDNLENILTVIARKIEND